MNSIDKPINNPIELDYSLHPNKKIDRNIWDDAYKVFFVKAISIKIAYEDGDMLGSQPHIDKMFSNPDELIILTKEQFINKIKTDDEFAKECGLKFEERELSLKERVDIFNSKMKNEGIRTKIATVGVDGSYWRKSLEETKHNTPTKLITISYNNETIESYE